MPENSLAEKLLRGGIWVLLGKIIIGLSSLLISAILARLLTPEELATYFLVFSLITFITFLVHLGLPHSIIRFIAEPIAKGQPARAKSAILKSLLLVCMAYTIAVLFLLGGGWSWISSQMTNPTYVSSIMLIGIFWILPLTLQNLLAEIFRGFNSVVLATVFGGLITSILSLLAFGTLFWLSGHSSLNQIIQFSALAASGSVIVAATFLTRRIQTLESRGQSIGFGEILTVSMPLWASSLFLFVISQADIWILAQFRPQEEVAIYGAAARLAMLTSMPLLVVNSIVPPIMARLYAQGMHSRLEVILRSMATFTGVPLGLTVLVILPFGSIILSMIFGSYYSVGWMAFSLLCAGHIVNVLMGSSGYLLVQAGRQKLLLTITLINGIISILISIFAVRVAGYNGLAAATMIGIILQSLSMWYVCLKAVGINTRCYTPMKIPDLWKNYRKVIGFSD
jgi:O-antigen/teichoic acid export membrane protein